MKSLINSLQGNINESKLDITTTVKGLVAAAIDETNNLTGVIVGGVFKYGDKAAQSKAEKIVKSLGYEIEDDDYDDPENNLTIHKNQPCCYFIYNNEDEATLMGLGNDFYILNSIE